MLNKKGGYFPLKYFTDFLIFLKNNSHFIEIITYNDLSWRDDFDGSSGYKKEKRRWHKEVRDKNKIYVLLQHDVDSRPERTMLLLKEEANLSVPTNIMIFYDRPDRRCLKTSGKLVFTEYHLDYQYLKKLEQELKFVIGYHCNAYEKSLFNHDKAKVIFEQDIQSLRQYFNIRFFSAHGGVPGPKNSNNKDIKIPQSLQNDIRWVHNGCSPYFTATYSDGGLNSPNRDPRTKDLRNFVRTWKRGNRYRILTHPQYYNSPCRKSSRMAETAWYEEVLEFYSSQKEGSLWDDVKLCI